MQRLNFIFLTLLVPAILLGSNTGKIAGRVTDSETGEPLIGANVMVVAQWIGGAEINLDRVQGAAADENGDFYILNLSPGLYSIQANYIGYQTERVTEIQVNVDFTTRVEFDLKPDFLQGEEVVVTAYQAARVEKEVTATKTIYNVSEVQEIAGISDVADILALQADVVDDHFRGGREGEASYLLGGAAIVNPLDNSRAFKPVVTGLEQVEVYTSGFSAEYGNAQSGVVNMVLKEGPPVWQTRIDGAVLPPYYKTWGGSPYDISNLPYDTLLSNVEEWLEPSPEDGKPLWARGYGFDPRYLPQRIEWPPNPLTRVDSIWMARLGQAAWYQGFREMGMEYNHYTDYRLDFSTGGPLDDHSTVFFALHQEEQHPEVPLPETDLSRQVLGTYTLRPDRENKYKLSVIYDRQRYSELGSNWLRWMFDPTMAVPKFRETNRQAALTWQRVFSRDAFLDAQLSIHDLLIQERIELLKPGEILSDYSTGNWVDYTMATYQRVGRPQDDYGDQQISSTHLKVSYTNQVNKYNLLKSGLQLSYYDLNVDEVADVATTAYYDVEFNNYPWEGALYFQDKMEYEGMIANLGLRYDFYDLNTSFYSDLYAPWRNPHYDPTQPYYYLRGPQYDPDLAAREETRLFTRLQPRMGVSFPVSETSVFHLNYGTFTQRPNFNQVFFGRYSAASNVNNISKLGNPRLKPEKTNAYDIGWVKGLPGGFRLDISAYYKDVKDLVETAYFFDDNDFLYETYVNRDYADIKGFHVNLEMTDAGWNKLFAGYLRYNWESAKGKSSNDFDAPVTYREDPGQGELAFEAPPPQDVFLDYDRTHKLVVNFRVKTPTTLGLLLGGNNMSITWRFYSGRPYSEDVNATGLERTFNERTPDEMELRARFSKSIPLGSTTLQLYVEGFNLLNDQVLSYSRNFNNSYNTGRWGDYQAGDITWEEYTMYDQGAPYYASQAVYIFNNEPRHFRIGLQARF